MVVLDRLAMATRRSGAAGSAQCAEGGQPVVAGRLRTYAEVVAWSRNPVVFATGALLLVCVTWHGIAGVHAIMLDLGLRGRAEWIVARLLGDLAILTVLYGLWLLSRIGFRG